MDDDKKVYFYWGCSSITPIWGVELDPETMLPVGEKKKLISGNPYVNGYDYVIRWILEGSLDNDSWFVLEDKSQAQTDLPHNFLVWEEGKRIRYLRLTILEIPYNQKPCISGIRVFGKGGW